MVNARGRSLGLDVGAVRIGVAVSDPSGVVATPLKVIDCVSPAKDAEAIARIAAEMDARRIVAGLPLNQYGERGPQADKVLDFLSVLREKVAVEIITQDERFTTAGAERMLIGAHVRRKRRKQVIDKIAAQQILQTYLDRQQRLDNTHEERSQSGASD